ncbi:MAG: cation:proton antiporter [Deltaproteobacteria bacterium]|nr:MAG: cation:proton antiporter [Deltaproteobacteria bacterium]
MSLPLTEPAYILALVVLGFLVLPMLAERLRVPGMVGILAAGALMGPNGLGLIERGEAIVVLGAGGLFYLMFMAGIELDLAGFVRERRRTMVFGALTFLIPQGVGTLVFLQLGYGFLASALIASMFASHTLLAYPIVSRMGLVRRPAVTMAVGGTLITDTVALMLLGVIAAAHLGDVGPRFWGVLLASILALYVFIRWILLPASEFFFRRRRPQDVQDFIFVLVALFVTVGVTRGLGIEPILGAFFAGLVLNRLVPATSALSNRIHFFGNSFFVPFFLLSVGMLVDVRILVGGPEVWLVAASMIACTLVSKWAAAFLASRFFGQSRAECTMVVGLTITQAAATLAATLVGFEVGLIGEEVLNAVVLLILATCVLSPLLVERAGRAMVEDGSAEQESGEVPRRVLVPMANPATADQLLELALALRGQGHDEPLQPLFVVREPPHRLSAAIAESERMLASARKVAAASAVPVRALTRVDMDASRGILRASIEARSSLIIMGWDASLPAGAMRLGRILDSVIEQSTAEVHVACLKESLRSFERIVLVVHYSARLLSGVREVMTSVRHLANSCRAPIHLVVVGADESQARTWLHDLPLPAESSLRVLPDDVHLSIALLGIVKAADLPVFIGGREHTVAWQKDIHAIPRRLEEVGAHSFLLVYPAVGQVGVMDNRFLQWTYGFTEKLH